MLFSPYLVIFKKLLSEDSTSSNNLYLSAANNDAYYNLLTDVVKCKFTYYGMHLGVTNINLHSKTLISVLTYTYHVYGYCTILFIFLSSASLTNKRTLSLILIPSNNSDDQFYFLNK